MPISKEKEQSWWFLGQTSLIKEVPVDSSCFSVESSYFSVKDFVNIMSCCILWLMKIFFSRTPLGWAFPLHISHM
jgi:hypothetical protein